MSALKRELSININNTIFYKDIPKGSPYYSPSAKEAELIGQLDLTSIRSSSKSHSVNSSVNSSKGSKLSFVYEDEEEEDNKDHEDDDLVTECELFIEIITDIFENDDIVDASIYGLFAEVNSDMDTPIAVVNIGNATNDKDMVCAIIEYDSDEKTIIIQQIARCSDSEISSLGKRGEQGSGMHIISKMKEVFFAFKSALKKDIKMIIGSDEANILIPISKKGTNQISSLSISLGWMSLFSCGQTWYNKLGFREASFVANSEVIDEYIQQPISAVVSKKIMDKLHKYGISDSGTVKDVFSLVLTHIKAISVATHKSKTGVASRHDIAELNVYDDLLNHCNNSFRKEAPHSFFTKFKNVPFVDDAGVGKKKKRTKKTYKSYKTKGTKKIKKN